MLRWFRKLLGKYTLKDYLSKDENGITYLERLLKEGKELDFNQEFKLLNSVEAGYIYAKYNKSLCRFYFTEEQLFTKIDNQFFIEYLISKDNYPFSIIEKITEHIEFIDIIIKHNKNKLILINKELVNKLLVLDNDNKYLIEKYINDETIMQLLIEKCDNVKIIFKIIENNNDLLKYCNEYALMSKINDNQTLLEYLLIKNIIPNKLNNIPNNKEYIKFLVDKEILGYFKYVSEAILLNNISDSKTLLELLLERNKIDKLNICINSPKTIKILTKFKRLDLIEEVSIKLLVKQSKKLIGNSGNRKNLLDYLLDNGFKPKFSLSSLTKEKEKNMIFSILYKRGEFELIAKSINKDSLFYSFDKKELLIDKLIQKNVTVFINNKINLKTLLNNYKNNKTYLEFILEKIKQNKIKFNLTNISFSGCNINDRAIFYITLAKHDMMKYINDLSEDDLLKKYNGKTLLEGLLNTDADLTLNKILSGKVKSNIKIAIILKSKGFIIEEVNIPLKKSDVTSNFLKKTQMRYGIGPLYEKGDYILNKLQNLFLNDGQSDKDLVMSLVCGYRQALITNYDVFIKELELLIRIKENNPHFYYLKTKDGSYFNPITGCIYFNEFSVDIVLHETAHAIHWHVCAIEYPNNFEQILINTRNNKKIIKKIKKFYEEYNIVQEKICKLVLLKYNNYFDKYYTEEKIIEIEEYLRKIKEEKKKEYSNLGIDAQQLDSILDEVLNIGEYIKNYKIHFINELFNAIETEEYEAMLSIFDIIDGIFEGDFCSNCLLDENGQLLKGISGHGIPYYSCNLRFVFSEMIANFSRISKCNNADAMLEALKNIIGEGLYNLISDYYNNIFSIENSKKNRRLYDSVN